MFWMRVLHLKSFVIMRAVAVFHTMVVFATTYPHFLYSYNRCPIVHYGSFLPSKRILIKAQVNPYFTSLWKQLNFRIKSVDSTGCLSAVLPAAMVIVAAIVIVWSLSLPGRGAAASADHNGPFHDQGRFFIRDVLVWPAGRQGGHKKASSVFILLAPRCFKLASEEVEEQTAVYSTNVALSWLFSSSSPKIHANSVCFGLLWNDGLREAVFDWWSCENWNLNVFQPKQLDSMRLWSSNERGWDHWI